MRTGDLIGTGTLSGPGGRDESGCLLEMSRGGREVLSLKSANGETIHRTFLEDGDLVEMSTLLKSEDSGIGNVGFGTLRGRVLAVKHC
jgi:fumarylacetoacetase